MTSKSKEVLGAKLAIALIAVIMILAVIVAGNCNIN